MYRIPLVSVSCSQRVFNVFSLTCALFLLAQPARAQVIDMSHLLPTIGKQIEAAMSKRFEQAASVSPAILRIESKTDVVTVTVTNPSSDTIDVELSLSTVAPLTSLADSALSGKLGKGLLANVKDGDEPKLDTVDASRSMASWIKDLPPKLRLAPNEKHVLTLKLIAPPDLDSGEYSAWIVATTILKSITSTENIEGGSEQMTVSLGGRKKQSDSSSDDSYRFPKGAKLIYVAK